MTLDELVAETLVQKNTRLRQASCKHAAVYCSSVLSDSGDHTIRFCLDCGKDMEHTYRTEKT